jgi:hypothetical protein
VQIDRLVVGDAARVSNVNAVLLKQLDELDRLICSIEGEFDCIDIVTVCAQEACRASSSRSCVSGARLLLSIDVIC